MPATSFLAEMIRAGQAGVTDPYVRDAAGADKILTAYGTATFVSGSVTIQTGLNGVFGFVGSLNATGFATGATEITNYAVNPVFTGTTGAVTIQGYRLLTTTASSSGTGTLSWFAYGK